MTLKPANLRLVPRLLFQERFKSCLLICFVTGASVSRQPQLIEIPGEERGLPFRECEGFCMSHDDCAGIISFVSLIDAMKLYRDALVTVQRTKHIVTLIPYTLSENTVVLMIPFVLVNVKEIVTIMAIATWVSFVFSDEIQRLCLGVQILE